MGYQLLIDLTETIHNIMITSNTSIPFIKAENSENKFYLSRLTSEYNEGDSITTSTDINCRKLAIALKAGDKITINGTSLTVYADAAVDATSFFVEAITLDEALNINANIAIDEDNMFVQYQRKTEGTVAGFDIDADGMSKGGVEITGWLDSDTMEGATANNIPTAESVKAYVDGQAGHSETLQEVTDNGNTTTNSIMIGSSSSPSEILHLESTAPKIKLSNSQSPTGYFTTIEQNYSYAGPSFAINSVSGATTRILLGRYSNNVSILPTGSGNVGIGTTSPDTKLEVEGSENGVRFTRAASTNQHISFYTDSPAVGNRIESTVKHFEIKQLTEDKDILLSVESGEAMRITSAGNVGIGTTAPTSLLHVEGTVQVGVDDTGHDVKFFGATSGRYMLWDESYDGLILSDNTKLQLGSSTGYGDLQLLHDGTNSYIQNAFGQLYINQNVNDGDIILQCDDGSGGITAYLTLDGSQETVNVYKNLLIGTTTDSGYQLDVNGTQRVQSILEIEDVLTLNAIATPDDPADGKSSIYMDSATGDIKVKINVGGEVVTRTLASYDG